MKLPGGPAAHPFPTRIARLGLFPVVAVLLLTAGCNILRYGVPAVVRDGPGEELVLMVGPLDLAAGTDHLEAPQPEPLHSSFPRDGWVQGFTVDVVDARGDTVPGEVLHHVKVLLPGRRELFKPIAMRLVGAGSETRSAGVPATMGVPVRKGDSLLVTAMVHNPTDRALVGVRIRVRLQYTGAVGENGASNERGRGVTEAFPFFLHVTPPDRTSDYDLPPGRSERSWEARPAAGGRIVMLGGHLHRYGVLLRFEDVTSGREIWRVAPRTDAEARIVDVPRKNYVWTRGPRLRPDHVYRVTAVYDNPTGETIVAGGMGTIGGVIIPDSPWIEVDTEDPLYLFDMQRELEHSHGDGHEGHRHHQPGLIPGR
jgi:hypothetical protein